MTPERRAVLTKLIDPASIAVVGVSPREGSFGLRTIRNLAGYRGELFLVNPRYELVEELTCYPTLTSLPQVPDLVVIAVGRELVEQVVQECAALGVGAVLVFASGYAEGDEPLDPEAQVRLQQLCEGMALLGPNCLGLVNFCTGMGATFNSNVEVPAPSRPAIGLVSQSGALGFALGQAAGNGMEFSHLLTCGNSADVDICDYIAYLAEDDRCQAIACVFEGLAQPRRLVEAALHARRNGKPLIIYKLATGQQGAAAAMSHTGSVAGSHEAYRATLAPTGAVLVDDWEDLLETASFFCRAGEPQAAGCAVVATSGGATIMAADCAERYGLDLPQPAPHTLRVLRDNLPEFASVRNPLDVTAQFLSDPESIRTCTRALLDDPGFGALVVVQTRANAAATERAHLFGALARQAGKPFALVWLTGWTDGAPGLRELESSPDVCVFRSMDRCCAALAAWQRWWAWSEPIDPAVRRLASREAAEAAAALLEQVSGRTLTERQAKEVLACYGIPVVREGLAQSLEQAQALALDMGYPVVLKVESPDLPHKTEAGVIALDVRDNAALAAEYDRILANAARVEPPPQLTGVLVQPMVGSGVEVIIGARVDCLFGPLVVVGLGGVLVEVLKDVQMASAPLAPIDALKMLDRLKGRALLQGFRGSEPVDREALADCIARLSEFVADQAHLVAEFDLNPVICSSSRLVAVDALIIKS